MTLRYPLILLLLLVVPLLVYLRHNRRKHLPLRFSDGNAVTQLPTSWAVVFQPILPALYAIGLIALVIATARPQKGLAESRVRTEAVDIVLLVDVSTSMRAEDFTTATRTLNRLDAAKTVIERFINDRPDDRIGMVAFSAMPYTVSPLTLDHGWLIQQMQRLETGMLEDGTAVGDAIASAVNRLRDSVAKSKVVILLTDGINNRGVLSPENAAQAAKALNIKVYTVGAGSSGIVRMPVMDPFGGKQYIRQNSEVDEGTLKRIADITGAMYFRATDFKGLEEVYKQIDKMEKTEVNIDQYTYFEERFMPWLLMGLLLLGLEKVLFLTRLGRLP
jgi:Ca-activated chloride channel family protein